MSKIDEMSGHLGVNTTSKLGACSNPTFPPNDEHIFGYFLGLRIPEDLIFPTRKAHVVYRVVSLVMVFFQNRICKKPRKESLGGGFNPLKKYARQNGNLPQGSG